MGGPPIAFPTPNFLIRLPPRKIDFYAPLPHFENPCLLELPSHSCDLGCCARRLLVVSVIGQWKTLFGSSTDESFPCSNIDKP